jgi:MFS family permease
MVAGVGGMLALSLGWLIGVRVVLGIGTCAGFPAAMAVLRKRADATGQGVPSRVLSVLAMSAQTIMVIGPTLGGVLIGIAGWPAIFAVNIPLAGLSLVLALLWVPKDDNVERTTKLLVVLLFVMEPALGDLYLLAVAAALGAVFARTELRSAKPFIDLRMLAGNGPLLRTYLRQALAFLIVYSIMFGYVQWLESARGMSESHAGAMLLPMSAVAVIAAALSGKPTGIKIRLVTNSLALLAGSAVLLVVDTRTWLIALAGIAAVFGLGQGLTSVTNQTALYSQAPAEQMGTASGLFRTAQYLGAIAASALIALCFGPHVTSAGLHRLAWTLAGVGVLLLAVTVADRGLGGRARSAAGAPVS